MTKARVENNRVILQSIPSPGLRVRGVLDGDEGGGVLCWAFASICVAFSKPSPLFPHRRDGEEMFYRRNTR